MTLEIERKFLVPRLPAWMAEQPSEQIEQGYLTSAADSVQVRLRRKDGEAILGVKLGTGLSRDETEIDVSPDQADELWPLTEGRRVKKVRHRVDHGEMRIEVDVFAEELRGLVVAEVEFTSEDESERFEAPEWFGGELTGRREFENECLAEEGLPDELE